MCVCVSACLKKESQRAGKTAVAISASFSYFLSVYSRGRKEEEKEEGKHHATGNYQKWGLLKFKIQTTAKCEMTTAAATAA